MDSSIHTAYYFNAGYSLIGKVEESKADEIRAMYETNVLGPVSVIQAVLPIMRDQGFGHILGTSSSLGHYVVPLIGFIAPLNGHLKLYTKVWLSRLNHSG